MEVDQLEIVENGTEFKSDVLIHHGFLKTFASIRKDLLASAEEYVGKYPGYEIVFLGHR